jgi:plasmid stabilization system protein ParE
MKIEITQRAKHDINEITKFIEKDSIYYAKKTVNEIHEKIYSIIIGLNDGRKAIEFDNENIREIIYKKHYRIIFEIKDNVIYIRTVWHTSRNPQKLKV